MFFADENKLWRQHINAAADWNHHTHAHTRTTLTHSSVNKSYSLSLQKVFLFHK